jgi:hypothetical protein
MLSPGGKNALDDVGGGRRRAGLRLARSVLQRPHVVAGIPKAANPDVARLAAHAEPAAQLGDIDAPTLRCIPPALPLQDELGSLSHGTTLQPWHLPTLQNRSVRQVMTLRADHSQERPDLHLSGGN